jgi:signal transduction histidine kinase
MTLAFALCIAGLLLSVGLLLVRYAHRMAERNADMLLGSAIVRVRHELPGNTPSPDATELREVENDLADENIAVVLLDRQGRVVEASRNAAAFSKAFGSLNAGGANRARWRTRTVSVGANTIVVGLLWAKTAHALNDQAVMLAAFSVMMGGTATLGAWLLVGRTLSPIGDLSQQARTATAEGGQAHLITPSQDAEVVELVSTLNDLLTRQREANAARGRFYAAASHELRTPLQALSGHLELALQRPRTGEEYLAVVQEAHAQTRRLTTLTLDLLRLHQVEGNPHPAQEPVDLSEVCERTLRSFAALIEVRGLTMQADMVPDAAVASAPTHADMMIRNLLENAVHYAVPGGSLLLVLTSSVANEGQSVCLELWNECDPDVSLQPERWLEAFYRPDLSRNAHTGGNGLGLAICKAIADVNGWELSLRREGTFIVARVLFAA